ncbi:nitroreductase/quinone reductase family protein [Spirillospora sp. CA-142024]|uniref:nitroreductase/quinone reductase family protein n=1 Tax=Spirillospora sp. CA-142024 TaxID=3240036 RepID=UPI003D90B7DC
MNDLNTRVIEEFRANGGHAGGSLSGTPMLLLHHVGARSGIERVTPLACSRRPDGGGGAEYRPRRSELMQSVLMHQVCS